MGKVIFIKTSCTVNCTFGRGAWCAAASGTNTWRKGNHAQPRGVPRLQGGGYAPGCEHLALGLSCPGVGARPASLTTHPGQRVC